MRTLITGCSSGIGRALAIELTRRGHEVIATARNANTLQDLQVTQRLTLDVISEQSIAAAVSAAGRIDALVNNAGVGLWGPVEATSQEDLERLFATNVYGPLRMLRAVLPQMRARRQGKIMQVSSVVGRVSGPLVGIYSASKHALDAYSEALRIELAPFGVPVTIVEPGAVESAFASNRHTTTLPDYADTVRRFTQKLTSSRAAAISSDAVARRLADIIETDAPQLRYVVTDDAVALFAARQAQSDAEWERQQLAP